ncbi:MAG TPA: hypothetical protein VGL56_18380 [Fimbriimonadaceae bacterium]|jgi:hypothetical protein
MIRHSEISDGPKEEKDHQAAQVKVTQLHVVIAIIVVLALLWALVNLSCSKQRNSARSSFSEYLDVSDQEETLLLAYTDHAYKAQRELPDSAKLNIYIFGHTVEPVYEGPPIHSRSQFNAKVASKLIHPAKELLVPFTRTELVLKRLAENTQTRNEEAWVFTDGGVEDQSTAVLSNMKRSIANIAKSPLQKLVIIGVHPESRFQWSDWLKPLLPERGVVRGLDDSDDLHPFSSEAK